MYFFFGGSEVVYVCGVTKMPDDSVHVHVDSGSRLLPRLRSLFGRSNCPRTFT